MLSLVPPVHRATHRIGLFLQATRPALGPRQGEAHLLAELHASGTSSVGALHRAFAHRSSTLTGILDRWRSGASCGGGCAQEDRRSFAVELTATGREARGAHARRLARLERGGQAAG